VQGFLAHQVGPHAREIALGQLAQALIQQVRDDQAQHRVAQKLQPLIVLRAVAAVGERQLQEARVGKLVA
jgi:hypothetical protein